MSNVSRPKRGVLCVGVATLDVISLLPSFPDANSRVEAQEIIFAGGGPAATAAVTLARLGHRVEMITAVGDDDLGKIVLAGLEDEGVGTKYITVVSGGKTSVSQVIVNTQSSERLIVTKPKVGIVDAVRSFDFDIESTWIHLDQTGYEALDKTGKREAVFSKHEISIDGGNHIDNLLLRDVDLYAPTITELGKLYGSDLEVSQSLQAALIAGARTVVATDGSNGSYSLDQNRLIHATAFNGPTHSTLGAGDVFHGALLSGLIRHQDLNDAMVSANLAAFISCEGIDGRSAIPTSEELQKAMINASRSE